MSLPELDHFLRDTEFPSMARRAEPLLVVDDSAAVRKILIGLLSRLGVRDVAEASNARDAFRILHTRKFRGVLCDIVMGDVSGIQLVQALRDNPETHFIPVLMMTASRDTRYVAQSKGQADGYILKPFTVEGLQRALHEILPTAVDEHVEAQETGVERVRVDRYARRE